MKSRLQVVDIRQGRTELALLSALRAAEGGTNQGGLVVTYLREDVELRVAGDQSG